MNIAGEGMGRLGDSVNEAYAVNEAHANRWETRQRPGFANLPIGACHQETMEPT